MEVRHHCPTPKIRKEGCEALGLFDRDGGYSDPQRQEGLDRRVEVEVPDYGDIE